MNSIRTLCAALICLVCVAAQAQWQWIGKDGQRVFSDRAPPPDIPAKNILKQPGGGARNVAAVVAVTPDAPSRATSAPGPTATASGPAAAVPKLSGVDKDLADKKKQDEAVAAAKTKAEEERTAKAKAENCERARSNKALLDSGVRLAVTNAKGEREIVDDAGRAAESTRLQNAMDSNCK